MSEDFHIDETLDTSWDDVGDLKTLDGVDQIHQAIVVTLIEDVGLDVASLQDSSIEEKRGDIENAVDALDVTVSPTDVTVSDIDYDERAVTYDVQTRRVSLDATANA